MRHKRSYAKKRHYGKKRKKTTRKKRSSIAMSKRKKHKGPRGGTYVIVKGEKRYI